MSRQGNLPKNKQECGSLEKHKNGLSPNKWFQKNAKPHKTNKDYVLFKINCDNVDKNVMIERQNIDLKFLKKQGRQLYRIENDQEFSFAYHPWRSEVAPEIGYIIKDNKMLNKIFHVYGSKKTQETATIILHIVFKEQYHIYEEKSPFGLAKQSSGRRSHFQNIDVANYSSKGMNRDSLKNSKKIKSITPVKNIHSKVTKTSCSVETKPSFFRAENQSVRPPKSISRNKSKGALGYDSQNYVFIKTKDRHHYDLNPKLLKFFLSEMLKDNHNKVKLYQIQKKINKSAKEKVFKFGMQQYFNVMDEMVEIVENTLKQQDQYFKSLAKISAMNKTEINIPPLNLNFNQKKMLPSEKDNNCKAMIQSKMKGRNTCNKVKFPEYGKESSQKEVNNHENSSLPRLGTSEINGTLDYESNKAMDKQHSLLNNDINDPNTNSRNCFFNLDNIQKNIANRTKEDTKL
ncbi:unnamed protein product [Moneuplotes crassus]|uniref:Uncharacterized protein n=1 Tax=Euplotes crassus TaxID=5936 RepID=A0AAD1X9X1_EUPCR|nr:unnamed protein product [Moneuplotes crassus]